MPLFARGPKLDLRVVLELAPQPDGTATGELDGVRVTLGRDGKLRIPLPDAWPGAMVSVAEPRPTAIPEGILLNRSRHPGWTSAALGRALVSPEVRACVDALPASGVRVEVHDDQLLVEWKGKVDGPSVRRTARGLVRLAQELPAARVHVVNFGVQTEFWAAVPSQRTSNLGAPQEPDSPEELLSRQLEAYQKRATRSLYGTMLGGAAMVFGGLGLAIAFHSDGVMAVSMFLGLPMIPFGILRTAWVRFTAPCPRCHQPRSSRPRDLVASPSCPRCGLSPTRFRVYSASVD